ncbi:O-succinylhomoserine sulfhydrylase [Usitatibacter palustris]|uniref:O-succinylhomoserine sulfhydrylase n=1 Tax=Usitatibacter palustris TaxID=2732487 RepID=A0A6M4H8H7_9PROT|nr:O-succinylhomoserine sulfhydrylase [Usitatibacter palustris]QJR14684.1 O-succinylhomoserine sulfhydrylase [Usitatibacter palustris]
MASDHKPDTLGVRAGGIRSDFQEHSEALVLSTSFVYKSAAEAARKFANEEPGYIYSRFTNPTVTMFQDRLAALEGAEACVATSTGMAAVATTVFGLLKAGDHMIAARGVFGTVVPLFDQILSKFNVETTWVDPRDADAWVKAVRPNTKLFFVESPSNPALEIADIAALATLAKKSGAILAVDNAVCSPALQQPIKFGADLVIHSATKYLDGQGRVLAGAIAGRKDLVSGPLYQFVRTAGPAISPFNAWVCLKGMETLGIRMQAQSANALEVARWLEAHKGVQRVIYPGLKSHPQHALAKRQQSAGGAVLSFVARGGREAAWKIIDAVKLISITANFGDVKSTICHPATTTHARLTPAEREAAGIGEGMIRLAVGLENPADVCADLERGLS